VAQREPHRPSRSRASAHARVEVDVEFFGIPLDGAQDVVFVLDHSGSMGGPAVGVSGRSLGMNKTQSALAGVGAALANKAAGEPVRTKMEAAKQELVECLRALPDGTRFNVVFFESGVTALSAGMLTLSDRTRVQAERFIAGIETEGSTAAVPALRAAYDSDARRVVLLSDGLANAGGDGSALLSEARAQITQGVRFDTVGLGLDQDAALMRSLARESGGMAVMR
jgi:hypothetical protein